MAMQYDKLLEHCSNNHEKYDRDEDIKLEAFKAQTDDFLDSKAGISMISNNNIGQDVLLEKIKVENLSARLGEDIGNTKNREVTLKEIETITVEIYEKNENGPLLQEDPLSKDYPTVVELEVNKEINLKNNRTRSPRRKHAGGMVFCKACNKMFTYQYYYKIHADSHAGNTPYKCDICEQSFVKPFLLKLHKIVHSETKPYSCKVCGKHFKRKNAVRHHQHLHSDNKPFPCDQCDKRFAHNYHLKIHKEIHETERKSFCKHCEKSFQSETRLRQHVRSMHLVKNVHICSFCGKVFNLKRVMLSHIKIHTGERPFVCEVCSKSFSRSSSLQIHMRTHTEDYPYCCKLCPAKFKYSQNLKRHIKLHIKKEDKMD